MRASLCLLVTAFAVLLALSCGPRDRRGQGNDCLDSGDCNDEGGGEAEAIEACVEGRCDEVECLTSAHCAIGTYCDVEDFDYRCREGCEVDGDCFAGQECDDGACRDYGCRSTVLDCDFNEVCDVLTGRCEEAEGMQCRPCDPFGNTRDDQGTPDACDDTIGGHQLCGGTGSVCGSDENGDGVCWPRCEEAGAPDQCPAGFSCGNVQWTPADFCEPVILGPYCIPTDGCSPNSP